MCGKNHDSGQVMLDGYDFEECLYEADVMEKLVNNSVSPGQFRITVGSMFCQQICYFLLYRI